MIKRILTVALALSTLFMLTACQSTPEEDIVAQKDVERMIEAANNGQAESDLSITEQYDIPDHYEYETTELDGRFALDVDADVIVPDVSSMPVARVQATDFTQEQVSRVFSALCGDAEMWNTREQGELTKSEIEIMILELQKDLSDESYLQNTDETKLEADKSQLEYLQSIYDQAPETMEQTECNGELTQKTACDIETGDLLYTYMGLNATSDDGQLDLYVVNRSGDCADNGSDGASTSATMSFSSVRNSTNFNLENSTRITHMDTIPEEAKNHGLTITPEEAADIANEFLSNAGLSDDIEIDNMYLINDSLSPEDRQELEKLLSDESLPNGERQSITASLSDDNENYAYYLCLVRQVNNTPCAYVDGTSYGDTSDQYAPYWEYEYIDMYIDEDGIFDFKWTAPVAVTEIATENAALKTFDEAMEIFKDAVSYTYVAQLQDSDISETFNIDRITLSLQRISEQNSLGYGLMVPVWNFYGTQQDTYTGDNGEVISATSVYMTSMLSINAIDGTIIDIEKGY